MLKVLNIGRGKVRGGAARRNGTTVGRPTHSESRRDRTAALIARNGPFLY